MFVWAGVALWATSLVHAQDAGIPVVRNLSTDLQRAEELNVPLIVLVSIDPCPYCLEVRRNYLLPMIRREAARGKPSAMIREVRLDMNWRLTDDRGRETTHREWAAAQGVKVAPTVLAFSAHGTRVGEPLVGAGLAGFYDAYLERLVELARAAGGG